MVYTFSVVRQDVHLHPLCPYVHLPYGCTSTPPIDVHPYRTSERCETILIGDLYHVFKRLIYLTSVSPSQMTNAIFRIRLSGAFSLLLAIVYPSNNCLILSTEESTYGTASKRPWIYPFSASIFSRKSLNNTLLILM